MKSIFVSLLLISFLSCTSGNEKRFAGEKESTVINSRNTEIEDSLFRIHFKILDSVAETPTKDTMSNWCYNSVNFMEAYTGIDADVDGDYTGATGFKKEDLRKWHQWYDGKKND